MKIIGRTVEGFLVSATEDEMCRLTGYPSNWYRERAGKPKVGLGDEVDVNMIYHHAEKMKTIVEDFVRAKAQIEHLGAGLVLTENLISGALNPPQADPANA